MPNASFNVTGDTATGVRAGPVEVVSQSAGSAILQESEAGVAVTEEANQEQTAQAQTEQATQLASAVVEAITSQAATTSPETQQLAQETAQQIETTTTDPTTTTTTTPTTNLNPIAEDTAVEAQVQATTVSNLIKNPGFETGDFSNWTLEGVGAVISQFGTLKPSEGSFFAIGYTGTGSIDLDGCSSGNP